MKAIIVKTARRLGFDVLNWREVKFRTLQGEFKAFITSDGVGFCPAKNPKNVHWTVHSKRKIPKSQAWRYLPLAIFEEPSEFHEKVNGRITKKFKGRTRHKPFGKFVEERMEEIDNA